MKPSEQPLSEARANRRISNACEYMDPRERDALEELGEIAACDDDERALVLQARSGRFDDGW